jgi:hypothetical protein
MKIIELVETREPIEEGPILNKLGSMAGNAVGTVAKGVGAVAGGVAGAWDAAKKGFKAGRAGVAAAGDDPAAAAAPASNLAATAPAAQAPAGPGGGGGATAAPAAAGKAAGPSGAPATAGGTTPTDAGPAAGQTSTAAPAAAGQPGGNLDQLKATISKLDPASKKQLVTDLQKSIASTSAQEPAAPAAGQAAAPAEEPAYDPQTGVANPTMMAQNSAAGKAAAPNGFNPDTGEPNPAPDATAAPAAGTAPAPTGTTPPAGGKMTTAQQAALKAKLQGQRQAGKTTATQTGSGFNQYVQGGGGSTLAGADAQGNPVFKQNVKREDIQFESKFLGMMI